MKRTKCGPRKLTWKLVHAIRLDFCVADGANGEIVSSAKLKWWAEMTGCSESTIWNVVKWHSWVGQDRAEPISDHQVLRRLERLRRASTLNIGSRGATSPAAVNRITQELQEVG